MQDALNKTPLLQLSGEILSRLVVACKNFTVNSVEKCVAEDKLQRYQGSVLSYLRDFCLLEVLFGDGKEELGLDQYQLMRALAIVRFWTLAMLAYVFLEEERERLQSQGHPHVTIG